MFLWLLWNQRWFSKVKKSFKNSLNFSLLWFNNNFNTKVDRDMANDGLKESNWPPCRPWPLWPSSWGPAYSSRGGAAGGAGGLHRWWCCAPGAGGQTCGRIHRLPQRQTYLFHHLRGWMRCHTPAHTHKDSDRNVLLSCVYNHTELHLTVQTHTYLFVMSNKLGLHMSRHQVNSSQHLASL